jgi:hypothetical protein
MAFELFSWAIGFALTNTARLAGAELFRKSLNEELRVVTEAWCNRLPNNQHVVAEALFGRILNDHECASRPAMEHLRRRLREKQIPGPSEWTEALFEHWQLARVRLGDQAQPFFLISAEEARRHLGDLARELHATCVQSESLFKATVISQIDELLKHAHGTHVEVLPSPLPATSDLRALRLAIEEETLSRIDLALVDSKTRALFIWGRIFGSSLNEIKWSLLSISCLAANVSEIDSIVVGVSTVADLPHSDGRGPAGLLRFHFSQPVVQRIAVEQLIPGDFWDALRIEVLVNDNTPFQGWKSVSWQTLEEKEQ